MGKIRVLVESTMLIKIDLWKFDLLSFISLFLEQ